MSMELHVTDLSCARGGVLVLEGVNLRLQAGEALILRGANGAGKTTLLRTIAGLQAPAAGSIRIPADAVAYSAHQDGLKAMLTVWENLTFWAQVHDRPVANALNEMDLAGLEDRPAHSLSAGQKRRLGLARLLVIGRPVWLLDEPTVSLDAASVALFARVVRAHLDRGGIALMATHIDLGIEAAEFDLSAFRTRRIAPSHGFGEAFL